ncbi:hypothetical protein ACS0TY_019453 [Phlomoides rotata]
MTKKKSSKTQEGPCTKNQRPSLKPKKMGSEIDEIFAAKKRKRPENDEKPCKLSSSAKVKSNGKMRMVRDDGNENERVGPTSRSQRKTADGLSLYTEEELGFGKSDAGGTPLCPFDCDCCF